MLFSDIYKTISRQEKKIVFWTIIFIVVFSSLPFLYGHFFQPKDQTFMDVYSLAPGDKPVYYSYINQIKNGDYLLSDLFTTEQNQIKMFNVFWLANGLLAKIFNLSAAMAFQIFRILLIPFAIGCVYFILAYFFQDKRKRIISFVLMAFSSGLGVLTYNFWNPFFDKNNQFNSPIDLYVPEANFFSSIFVSPHFIASVCLIFLSLFFIFVAWEKNKYKYSILAGICSLVLLNFHPFHILTVYLIPGMFLFFKTIQEQKLNWIKIKHFLIMFGISLPSVIYFIWLLNNDLIWRLKALQNDCFTPSFFFLAIGLGCLLIGALLGVRQVYKNKKLFSNSANLFFFIWLATQFILVYSPINFQRRMLEGIQLPLVFFSTFFIDNLFEKEKFKKLFNKYTLGFYTIFILLFCFSNFANVVRDIYYLQTREKVLFLHNNIYSQLQVLDKLDKTKAVYSSSVVVQNRIPGVTGNRIFIGHGVETVFYRSKFQYFSWFFQNNKYDRQKLKFLKDNNIGYILMAETELKNVLFNPQEKNYLEMISQNGDAALYQVL